MPSKLIRYTDGEVNEALIDLDIYDVAKYLKRNRLKDKYTPRDVQFYAAKRYGIINARKMADKIIELMVECGAFKDTQMYNTYGNRAKRWVLTI